MRPAVLPVYSILSCYSAEQSYLQNFIFALCVLTLQKLKTKRKLECIFVFNFVFLIYWVCLCSSIPPCWEFYRFICPVKPECVIVVLCASGCFRWRRRRMPWTGSLSMPSSFALSMRRFLWRLRPSSQSSTASAATQTGVQPTSPWRQAWESVSNITMSKGETGNSWPDFVWAENCCLSF